MKIYDCTTFYNANLLFETRVKILDKFVDYFVVCEASKDHVGKYKGYNFKPKIDDHVKKKIIYIQVDDLPNIKLKGKKDYKLLKIQMERLKDGLTKADDQDLILFSDEDEIPSPDIIKKFEYQKYKYAICLQNLYLYKINIISDDHGIGNWPGTRMSKKKDLKSFFKLRLLKIKDKNYPSWRIDKEKNFQILNNGGWHFSYLMKPEEILNKIQSAAHTEYNTPKYSSLENVINSINHLKDPFGRNINLKRVEIDSTFPDYIIKNINLFKDWIAK